MVVLLVQGTLVVEVAMVVLLVQGTTLVVAHLALVDWDHQESYIQEMAVVILQLPSD